MLKKLPIGIQNLPEIILENYLYVDKTKYVYDLITTGKYYFISRPRRFGKSLLVSTLNEIFSGNKEIFKDLWIYDKINWEKYPVIHIDFNVITHNRGMEIFENSLLNHLKGIAEKYKIKLDINDPKEYLKKLTEKLSEVNNVVLLIDEYDKPIIDYMSNMEKANENKEFLSSFYEVIKGLDKYFKFVLLTGVSKFSKVSIFSKLNNLKDISLNEKYSGMLGITQEELEYNFKENINKYVNKKGINKESYINRIKKWYNGYSWDGVVKVYNPFSILNYFSDEKFRNYWFDTGTPGFLIDQFRKNNYKVIELEQKKVEEYVFNSYDIENIDITCLLFQTGYTTIKSTRTRREKILYNLSIPNYEVKDSLFNYILSSFANKDISSVKPPYIEMLDELEEKNIKEFINLLQSSFAAIPYNIYPKREDYYHSVFYLMMVLLGAEINAEVLTDKGRIDCVIDLDEILYVIELKLGTSKEALKQIKDKKYYEKYIGKYDEIILLGIGGFEEKEIEYSFEIMNKK